MIGQEAFDLSEMRDRFQRLYTTVCLAHRVVKDAELLEHIANARHHLGAATIRLNQMMEAGVADKQEAEDA